MSDDFMRPSPEIFLALNEEEGRGALKVFLGAAPGVGKTYEMLRQAQKLQREGHDVLVGYVETHGRPETAAQLADLPLLPRRISHHHRQRIGEFDLQAALERHPAILLLDELAHANAPGSLHPKRWQDVEELRSAGIEVWSTLNVQHLESLNADIQRITGISVQETVPDEVLTHADSIELVDIPPRRVARTAACRACLPATARRPRTQALLSHGESGGAPAHGIARGRRACRCRCQPIYARPWNCRPLAKR